MSFRFRFCLASLLLFSFLAIGCGRKPDAAAPPPPPVVYVQPPRSLSVEGAEELTGWTVAQTTVHIRARVTGYLDQIAFKDGDDVKEGTELFVIDPRTYKAEFEKAEAEVKQKVASLERLTSDLRRARAMIPGRGISAEELDKIAGNRLEADAAVNAAKAHLDYAKLNLQFTRVKAPISGRLSRTLVDKGNLVKADDTQLTTLVSMDPIHAYFDIDERTVLKFRRLIAQKKIESARSTKLMVDIALADEEGFANADDTGKTRQGVIDFVDNQLDPGTGTLRVRAEIANPRVNGTYMLSPGMFVRVRLPIGKPEPSLLVPEEALGSDQGNRFLYVIGPDGKALRREVVLGPQIDPLEKRWRDQFSIEDKKTKWRVVTPRDPKQTITAADRVIVKGQQRVRRDDPSVTVRPVAELYAAAK